MFLAKSGSKTSEASFTALGATRTPKPSMRGRWKSIFPPASKLLGGFGLTQAQFSAKFYLEENDGMKKRLNVYLTDETIGELHAISDKTGLSMTAIGTLAISAGIKAIQLSLDPKWQARFEQKIIEDDKLFNEITQGKVEGA